MILFPWHPELVLILRSSRSYLPWFFMLNISNLFETLKSYEIGRAVHTWWQLSATKLTPLFYIFYNEDSIVIRIDEEQLHFFATNGFHTTILIQKIIPQFKTLTSRLFVGYIRTVRDLPTPYLIFSWVQMQTSTSLLWETSRSILFGIPTEETASIYHPSYSLKIEHSFVA